MSSKIINPYDQQTCCTSIMYSSYVMLFIMQELNLPLNASSWTEEDLKDSKKLYEMTVLLNAQREIADKILDTQWEAKWREEKVSSESKKALKYLYISVAFVYFNI